MNKVIYNKFDKSRISQLPRVTFPGRIVVILNETEAEKAVDYLLSRDIIGVDTETRPVFKKGHRRKVALLQACDHEVCFLFRLNYIGFPDCIKRLSWVITRTISPSSNPSSIRLIAPEKIHGWKRSRLSSFPRFKYICLYISVFSFLIPFIL